MWALRRESTKDGIGILVLDTEYEISYYQVSKGEFVVFSQDIQDSFEKKQKSKRDKKLNKKLAKVNKQIRGDYGLKRLVKEQFKAEEDLQVCH